MWDIIYGVCARGRKEAALLWMHSDRGSPRAEAKAAPASRITWLPDPLKGFGILMWLSPQGSGLQNTEWEGLVTAGGLCGLSSPWGSQEPC